MMHCEVACLVLYQSNKSLVSHCHFDELSNGKSVVETLIGMRGGLK
jgi:hypothetical protein